MWQKMLQVGSGGGSLDTFSIFDIKTDEDELAGEEVVISFQDPSYIIASVRFSNIRSADGLYHTPSVTVQSIGTYTFNCGTAKEIKYTISSFDMTTPIDISMEIIREIELYNNRVFSSKYPHALTRMGKINYNGNNLYITSTDNNSTGGLYWEVNPKNLGLSKLEFTYSATNLMVYERIGVIDPAVYNPMGANLDSLLDNSKWVTVMSALSGAGTKTLDLSSLADKDYHILIVGVLDTRRFELNNIVLKS